MSAGPYAMIGAAMIAGYLSTQADASPSAEQNVLPILDGLFHQTAPLVKPTDNVWRPDFQTDEWQRSLVQCGSEDQSNDNSRS